MHYVEGENGSDRARRITLYTHVGIVCVYVEIDTHILVDSIALRAHHILYYIGRRARASAFIYQSLNL